MGSNLILPGGMPSARSQEVVSISEDEVKLLSRLDAFARKHGLMIVCPKCDHALQGQNNESSRTLSAVCRCREFRYRRPDAG